jgi:hypothetical protein
LFKDELNLSSGSNTEKGEGLHIRRAKKRSQAKSIAADLVESAKDRGILATAESFLISPVSVVKEVIKVFKRDDDLDISSFISSLRVSEIEEYLYSANSTSIKKLLLGKSDLEEWELRLVKANIEKKGADSWEY